MNQKENLVVKGKVKTKDGYQYKETKLDIYQLHDENGVSLGDKLDTLTKNYDRMVQLYERSNKKVTKFDNFIKTIAKQMNISISEAGGDE